MISIGSTLLIFVFGIFALMVSSIWYMNFMMKIIVGKKHEWIEFILHTSAVPKVWSKSFDTKFAKFSGDTPRMEKLKDRANQTYIKRLDQLISYMKVSTLIESEQTRNETIKELMNIRELWKVEGVYVQ